MRAVNYMRASTVEQTKKHSLDAQRTSTTTFIRQRGWTHTHEYLDAGLSAKSEAHRPALEQLLADAEQHHFDVIVVDKIDRFYRNLRGLLATLERLNRLGISFVSVKENLDFTTPWGKLSLTVLGMLAEIYIDNLSQETHKGLIARARKGLWNGSIPFGYCTGICTDCTDPNGPGYCPHAGLSDLGAGGILIAHPIESIAVQRAFAWYIAGAHSDGDIAERLNAEPLVLPDGSSIAFRTKGLPGRWSPGPISKESVRELLQRRFYTGVVPYFGVDAQGRKRKRGNMEAVFPGQHPALVSVADFERAQELRQQLSRRSRTVSREPRVYLLSGVLICDSCGRTMRAMTCGPRRYYRDLTRVDHTGVCEQPTLKAEEIEAQVRQLLRRVYLPPHWQTQLPAWLLTNAEYTELTTKRAEMEARWQRAREMYLEGLLTKMELQTEQWHYNAGMSSLTPHEITAIIKAGNDLETLLEVLNAPDSTLLQQNELLRLVLAGVRVKGYKLTALQPNLYVYPLMQYCLSGSDGQRPGSNKYPILPPKLRDSDKL